MVEAPLQHLAANAPGAASAQLVRWKSPSRAGSSVPEARTPTRSGAWLQRDEMCRSGGVWKQPESELRRQRKSMAGGARRYLRRNLLHHLFELRGVSHYAISRDNGQHNDDGLARDRSWIRWSGVTKAASALCLASSASMPTCGKRRVSQGLDLEQAIVSSIEGAYIENLALYRRLSRMRYRACGVPAARCRTCKDELLGTSAMTSRVCFTLTCNKRIHVG